tara:strand:+ start:1993 stop:2388 length:396 start_codon:yes stop_codon:yes gene_type:complete
MAHQERIDATLQGNLGPFKYTLRETSYLGLKPGDLIQITYSGRLRYGLVIGTPKNTRGMFVSSRYNSLLNVVVIESLNEGMFSVMVNNLYKNPVNCTYSNSTIIGAFLGKKNLRSFNTAKFQNVLSIEIQR